ncbi:class I SAM-dependent methyltransferase [Vibrio vulnificus]|nr:methyltransferase domain-containing protein [Vibrio vulnificus]MCU8221356.1 class I SAM-dependent methyltransferase [Vibrio vulnificus]
MKLENVVPWGRTLKEYELMFNILEEDKEKRILGCGDGPASFNAELTQSGRNVVSIDPIYQLSKQQISRRIDEVRPIIMQQLTENVDGYVWDILGSPQALENTRMMAMNHFLADYEDGKNSQRYVNGSLPQLPFDDKEFDLALCSHFLFLYDEHLSELEHIQAITELVRVSQEVRIYPLISLNGNPSSYVSGVIRHLESLGASVSLESVEYEFQKGATQMLVVKTA